ncbi:MAG: hypothetical protein KBT03_12050 [Bacteroidales bacterium]|nr:hypothetical protein [Candidatus Scybalousia scybalohippi]
MIEFPKKPTKKKRKVHAKSIMQRKDGTCYLCKWLHDDWTRHELHEHHVFGGVANRTLSEQYGLKVYLCLEHHLMGAEAVHKNKDSMDLVRREGQKAFERNYPELDFVEVFGKNYL